MTDHPRVLRATEQIREEIFQRSLGRAPDDRYDFIIDALLDFSDDLSADDAAMTHESRVAPDGYSGAHTPPDAVILGKLTQINDWIEEGLGMPYETQPLAAHWARLAKVAEEVGEVMEAAITWTGANPRKQQRSEAFFEMLDELCDVIVTTLLAILHFDMDAESVFDLLWTRVDFLHARMLGSQAVDRHDDALRRLGES